jgi:2,3-dihydroxybenzoate decarboxylase
MNTVGKAQYRRIATEEAFAPPEMLDIYRKLIEDGIDDPGFRSLWGFYGKSPTERSAFLREGLVDLGALRLGHMDAAGIDMQVLSLTAPGVQIMDRDTAVPFAAFANDYLADAVKKHPTRFAGLAAFAPQDPAAAAKEIARGKTLGLKGAILNSHTHGEYLDTEKYWPIFEAAEAEGMPIYLHPTSMSKALAGPFVEAGLDGAIYGFGVETGLHMLRIIRSGAFDRFPKLNFVVGHLGEALPFWLFRLDYMHKATMAPGRYPNLKPLKKQISDYMRENVYVTTSGMASPPAIRFCQDVLGMDRVLYAMDYPYQYDPNEVIAQDNLAISDADKKRFFQTNAERVFGL